MLIKHLLENTELSEVNMSPSSLKAMAAKVTDARVGMEFEMYVPNAAGGERDADYTEDWNMDGYITTGTWNNFKKDIVKFFSSGDYSDMSETQLGKLVDGDVQEQFFEWLDGEWYDYSLTEFSEWWSENNPDDDEPSKNSPGYHRAMDDFKEEKYDEWLDDEDRINLWLEDQSIDKYRTFASHFELHWPYMTDENEGGSGDIDDIAADFERAVGISAYVSNDYHGRDKPDDAYMIEPDSSLDHPESREDSGWEFVSPPLSVSEMIDQLTKVKKWAGYAGCYTNSSTGLHINVSMPGYSIEKLDYIKLALFLGDDYVSNEFGRLGSTYAKSSMAEIKKRIKPNQEELQQRMMGSVRLGMMDIASKLIHSGHTEKYVSINTKDNRIEFRSPGGDWLDTDIDKLINTMLRFIVAMDIALDPEKEKKEYAKKFFDLLKGGKTVIWYDPKDPANQKNVTNYTNEPKKGFKQMVMGEDPILRYFVQYATTGLPKAALKSFIRQAQMRRQDQKKPPAPAAAAPSVAPSAGEQSYEIIHTPGQSSSARVVHTFTASSPRGAERYAQNWADEHDIAARYRLQLVGGPRGGEVGTYKITYTQNGQEQQTVVDANSRREAVDFFQSNWPGSATLVRLELMP